MKTEKIKEKVYPYGNSNLKFWDEKMSFSTDIIYHLNNMVGLPHVEIKENRDAKSRYKNWNKAFSSDISMTTPATLVKARIVKEIGLTPIMEDDITGDFIEVPEDQLDKLYCLVDGHGRYYYYKKDLDKAKIDPTYTPLDFIFQVREYTDSDKFKRELVSMNLDQQKTTRFQLAALMVGSIKDKHIEQYLIDVKENHFVAKASAFKNYGRELMQSDWDALYAGKSLNCNERLLEYTKLCYECYEKVFTLRNELKILRGVPLARFTQNQLIAADNDMSDKAEEIIKAFTYMDKSMRDDIVSAKKIGTLSVEYILIDLFETLVNEAS